MKLTQDQVHFFRTQGYFKLCDVVPSGARQELVDVICDLARQRLPPLRVDAVGNVLRLDQLIQRHAVVHAVATTPALLDTLESLLGPNIVLTLNRHNHVTFNSRSVTSFRLHRDVLQWSRGVVTAILYLEDATVENGCTYIIPGSHFLPFVGIPNNGGTWMDEHAEFRGLLEQAIPVPMPAWSALLFDSLIFHSVGVNNTSKTRISLCLGFHSVDELSGHLTDPKILLVRGSWIYKGNDAVSY